MFFINEEAPRGIWIGGGVRTLCKYYLDFQKLVPLLSISDTLYFGIRLFYQYQFSFFGHSKV